MTDTGNELSEILSDTPAPAAVTGADTTTAVPADTGQGRDEHGRFAPKAGDTQPAATVTPQAQPVAADPNAPPEGMVPHGRFHAVNETAKAEKARADRLEAMLEQALKRPGQQQPPAQQQEKPKPKDLWEDPDGFVAQALSPLQQQMQRQRESFSRMMAVSTHGKETVDAAYKAMADALATNPQTTVHDYHRIMATDHPYDEMVAWNKRNAALSRVGADPDAFVKSELDKLLADPAKAAEILQRIQAGVTAQPPNRSSAPATVLPPSLSKLPGGTNTASAGLGDDTERFKAALAR